MRISHAITDERRVVLLPLMKPRAPGRAVLYAHQNGANANTVRASNQPYFEVIPNQLGVPLVACDDGGPSTWGNDASQTSRTNLFNWATDLSNNRLGVLTDKVVLMGGSMGCQVNAIWAKNNLAKVSAIVNVIGIPNVEAARAENRNGVAQGLVETAYVDNAGWQAARATHNPLEFASQLAGIPILDFYSENDPFSTPAEHAALAAAVGPSMTTVSMGAVGHTFFGLDVERLRDFIRSYI